MVMRDNENKQHNDASLEPRKKEQVKHKQTNKQKTEEYDKLQISRRAERNNKDQSRNERNRL